MLIRIKAIITISQTFDPVTEYDPRISHGSGFDIEELSTAGSLSFFGIDPDKTPGTVVDPPIDVVCVTIGLEVVVTL